MTDQIDAKALIDQLGSAARAAAAELAFAPSAAKEAALMAAADAVWARRVEIMAANGEDMAFGAHKGLSPAMMDRLALEEGRIKSIVEGLRAVPVEVDIKVVPVQDGGATIGKVEKSKAPIEVQPEVRQESDE